MMAVATQLALTADEAVLAARIFSALRAMDDEHRETLCCTLPTMAERIAVDHPRRKLRALRLIVGGS